MWEKLKYMGNYSSDPTVVYGKAGRLLEDYLAEGTYYNRAEIQVLLNELGNDTFKSNDTYEQWRGHVLSALGTALEMCGEDSNSGWSIFHEDKSPAVTRMYETIERFHGRVGMLPSYVP